MHDLFVVRGLKVCGRVLICLGREKAFDLNIRLCAACNLQEKPFEACYEDQEHAQKKEEKDELLNIEFLRDRYFDASCRRRQQRKNESIAEGSESSADTPAA